MIFFLGLTQSPFVAAGNKLKSQVKPVRCISDRNTLQMFSSGSIETDDGSVVSDFCLPSDNHVAIKVSCDSTDKISLTAMKCSFGCSNGACCRQAAKCLKNKSKKKHPNETD
jgi:hypothetical protein